MKIDPEVYGKMRAAMKAVVEYLGGSEKIKVAYAQLTPGRMLWDVWHMANHNLRYDDNHPAFVQGVWTRLFPYDPTFDFKRSVNDSHIETALKRIGKELGL